MLAHYGAIFWELIRTPFQYTDLIWGIVPLYFGWLVNELTSSKASFKTAIQTGFSFLWAGAHWTYQSFGHLRIEALKLNFVALMAVNAILRFARYARNPCFPCSPWPVVSVAYFCACSVAGGVAAGVGGGS